MTNGGEDSGVARVALRAETPQLVTGIADCATIPLADLARCRVQPVYTLLSSGRSPDITFNSGV
nr:hypothetical protein [Streptomyces antibioticus]